MKNSSNEAPNSMSATSSLRSRLRTTMPSTSGANSADRLSTSAAPTVIMTPPITSASWYCCATLVLRAAKCSSQPISAPSAAEPSTWYSGAPIITATGASARPYRAGSTAANAMNAMTLFSATSDMERVVTGPDAPSSWAT